MLNVKDIGEQGLLKKLQAFCPTDIIGDDGAILQLAKDKKLVVTTDVLVDKVHFSNRTTSAFDVIQLIFYTLMGGDGDEWYKLANQNLVF